jgi:hypothetical protein
VTVTIGQGAHSVVRFLGHIRGGYTMALGSHIDQLKQKHVELEDRLEEAMRHPSSRDDEIAEIKRQKLLLKDKIKKLTN